ncbi:UTRA domain-containing protein [Nonomuraea sp. LPB2021202275-12-8]|uniref:UTRA domain-containing protein n=1 Tax=Nonomuraea sp. LPB2021202275-12-8 TaxID=3120159 RepID=UPI00300D3FBD
MIADEMRELIALGEWPPGSLLPVSAALLERFRTTVPTLARATGVLRDEGLLSRAAERGRLKVTDRPAPLHLDLDDGDDAWEAACARADVAGEMRQIGVDEIRADDVTAAALGIPCGTMTEHRVRHAVVGKARTMVEVSIRPLALEGGLAAEAAEEIGARVATKEEAEVLGLRPGGSVLTVERITYDDGGLPLELRRLAANPLRVRVGRRTRLPAR